MAQIYSDNFIDQYRKPDYPILPQIYKRWSPRAMTGEEISEEHLMTLFEAARWAPSSMNNQLWRFVYAKRDTKHWQSFFELLGDFNQMWCKNASALVIVISRDKAFYKDNPHRTHAFEAGFAMQNFMLQAVEMGIVVHGMSGFDYDAAHKLLKLNEDWHVQAMFAVGHPAEKSTLPESLQEREEPSGRKTLSEIVYEGTIDISKQG